MTIKLANNVTGFLNTAITASDTGVVLQSGNGASFPSLGAGEYFYATLVSTGGTLEVVKVTARSGDSMTVLLGVGATDAAAKTAAASIGAGAVPILPGAVEILGFPAGSYFSGVTGTSTSLVYVTPGEGI